MAVSAVLQGGLSLRAAHKHYNVPYSSLQWRVKNRKQGKIRRGRKPALGENTEKTIIKAALAMKEHRLGLSRKEVGRMG